MLAALLLVLTQLPPPPTPPPAAPMVAPPPTSVPNPWAVPAKRINDNVVEGSNVIHFAPLSLGALYFSLEYERAIATQFSVFGILGAGITGTYGFDFGFRWYLQEKELEGLFGEARLSGAMYLPGDSGPIVLGPGTEFGYSFRWRRLVVSAGLGVTMWYTAKKSGLAGGAGTGPLGLFPASTAVIFAFPGIYTPPDGRVGVQPTIRFSMGFSF